LGNPGPRYRDTRHNVGFVTLDRVAERLGAAFGREKYDGAVAEAAHRGEKLLLLKPMTFMNRSGISVAQAARNRAPDAAADLLIVTDDVNLPLGRLRIRSGGSAGGHNGLKSIIEHLGTQDFPRLRIGVGDKGTGSDLSDHVLGKFAPEEAPAVRRAVERATEAVLCFVESGVERAMNEYNRGDTEGGRPDEAVRGREGP
jgi:PTH1 family peptidyl-tRNA hydrolase